MHTGPIPSGSGTVVDAGNQTNPRGRKMMGRVVEEVRRFMVMFLYLWILFGLFALYQRILLRQEGLDFTTQGFALVNALVLAKVMLIAEDLKIGRWVSSRRLIYPILGESFIFTVVFICFHIVEHVVVGLFKRESIAASIPAIGGGGLAGLVSVGLILFVSLIPFFAFRHLSRELGTDRLKAMLFGTALQRANEKKEKMRETAALRRVEGMGTGN